MTFQRKIFYRSCLISLLLSFPITGFIYGYNACKDCGNSVIGRIFIGFVEAVLTTISLGNPVNNEAGTSATNIRWYVAVTFLLLIPVFYFILSRRYRNK